MSENNEPGRHQLMNIETANRLREIRDTMMGLLLFPAVFGGAFMACFWFVSIPVALALFAFGLWTHNAWLIAMVLAASAYFALGRYWWEIS